MRRDAENQPIDYAHRNAAMLAAFTDYCQKNPQLRFWQALALWTDTTVFIRPVGAHGEEIYDTWAYEGKNG